MQKLVRSAVFAGYALGAVSQLYAQRGSDWMTIGSDGQRSGWVRGDAKISAETMEKPGFELVWKVKLQDEREATEFIDASGAPRFLYWIPRLPFARIWGQQFGQNLRD